MDQDAIPYVASLRRLADLARVRLLVPGHGGDAQTSPDLVDVLGEKAVALDVTSMLWGVDRTADDGLEQARRLAADAYGARRTWLLTNGSSQGNRMALLAIASRHGGEHHVVAQRSAHSSFVDGLMITGLTPFFVTPTADLELGIAHDVHADDVAAALDAHPGAKAVYVISPSYFGAVADIPAISAVAHAHGVPLIVDGAWGPHFGFHPELPANPLAEGADVLVTSTHKLGGSLHQSAMLHLADGAFADELEPLLDRAHRSTQSTSQSTLLIASLDVARRDLVRHPERLDRALRSADRLVAALEEAGFPVVSRTFPGLRGVVANDPLNVTIDVRSTGIDGAEVRERLALEHGVLLELSTASTVVALIAPGLDLDAALVVDALVALRHGAPTATAAAVPPLPAPGPMRITPREAYFAESEVVSATEAVGRVAADSLAAYPPGIPNVMAGEEITAETVAFLGAVLAAGGYVRGAVDGSVDRFRVVTA